MSKYRPYLIASFALLLLGAALWYLPQRIQGFSEQEIEEFFVAIEHQQNKEVFSRLKLGMSPEVVWNGYSALTYSAEVGNLEAVKLLLDAGAQYDKKDPRGRKALRVAALKPHFDIIKLLQAQAK